MASYYDTGTVSVAVDGTAVTGSGSSWLANAKEGDLFLAWDATAFGIGVLASDPSSNTALTLANPWLGPALTGADYLILHTGDGWDPAVDIWISVQALLVDLEAIAGHASQTDNPHSVTAAQVGAVALTGDETIAGIKTFSSTPVIPDNGWALAKLAQMAGLSIPGVTGNATANLAAITAGTDGHVLRRSGTALAFGTVATAGIADAAVTLAKMENRSEARIIGRAAGAGTGVPTALTAAEVMTILNILATVNSWTGRQSFDNGVTGIAYSIADDAVATFTPSGTGGGYVLLIAPSQLFTTDSVLHGVYMARISSATRALSLIAGTAHANVAAVLNTVLTGTAGADGKMTIAANNGNFQIENRSGATRSGSIFIAANA